MRVKSLKFAVSQEQIILKKVLAVSALFLTAQLLLARVMCDIVAVEREKLPACSLVRIADHLHS